MNKNIIKIGVPIIVLFAIIIIIANTQKPINKLSSELSIEPFDFNAYVDHYISDSIDGQVCSAAKNGYDKLYQIISTESSITSSTPESKGPLLSPQDAEECFENAFKAYFSIFGSDANQLFSKSSWGESELSRILNESQRLLKLNGSESARDSLNHYINYVNGYYSTKDLIKQSWHCSSADDYERYLNSARTYNTFPFNNNSNLKDITSKVANNAQEGWRNSITNDVERVCEQSCDYYSTYNDFRSMAYQKAYEKISEYNDKFNTTWGANLKSNLSSKDSQVKDYFNNPNR